MALHLFQLIAQIVQLVGVILGAAGFLRIVLCFPRRFSRRSSWLFIAFGTGAAGVNDSQLSPGIQEALSDLSAISQVSTPEDDGEEEERMLEQVTEHCRMAAMMIYTDLVMKPAARDTDTKTDTNPPTRH